MPPSIKKELMIQLKLEGFSRAVQKELLDLSIEILHDKFIVWIARLSSDALERFHGAVSTRSKKRLIAWFQEEEPEVFGWFENEIDRLKKMINGDLENK